MYRIAIEAENNLISVVLGGMMCPDEVSRYIGELRDNFIARGMRSGYRMLIDVSACPIQSQTMIEAMREHMANFPKASRIGMVTGTSLARMQVRRLMTQSYARVFDTVEDARSWLVSPDESCAA